MNNAAVTLAGKKPAFTVKNLLTPLLAHPRVAHLLKYTVYAALVVNFGIYAYDDWMAYRAALGPGAPFLEIMEQFATTIDTAAWLGLVFLFELETHALPDHLFMPWVSRLLIAARLVCYVAITYGAYGYTASTLSYYTSEPVTGVSELCQLAGQGQSLQLDTISYVAITTDNCATLADASDFHRVPNEISVIDGPTLTHVKWMGWVDVENAFLWLLVVFLIEIELRLQAADQFSGRPLQAVRQAKTALYLLLILNIFLWGADGYIVYAWDAFLWIFGFWAIELNFAEWELERQAELAIGGST